MRVSLPDHLRFGKEFDETVSRGQSFLQTGIQAIKRRLFRGLGHQGRAAQNFIDPFLDDETSASCDYGIGAQILLDPGVGHMTLLTSSKAKLAALEGFGLTVTGRLELREENPVSHLNLD